MTYPTEFEEIWKAYPRRPGNNKRAAFRQFTKRVAEGSTPAEMLAGTKAYAAYIRTKGDEGTQYVKLAATFLGPDAHYESDWALTDGGTLDDVFEAFESKEVH